MLSSKISIVFMDINMMYFVLYIYLIEIIECLVGSCHAMHNKKITP